MEIVVALVVIVGACLLVVALTTSVDYRQSRRRLIDSLRRRCLKKAGDPVELDDRLLVPFELDGREARLRLPGPGRAPA
jgi:hypothetical protein